ncbi:hypothetical protein CKAH01_11510 [Colletotrichum kahawae]|uniref:Uncharacterized protein n=1 Tax=Colletotrichum kahawae TaxID=34407 RepID=A0AAD9YVV5_COLKA|nr:hypothetical protein CKAH01_11510 [Colletotrichum kahawae]
MDDQNQGQEGAVPDADTFTHAVASDDVAMATIYSEDGPGNNSTVNQNINENLGDNGNEANKTVRPDDHVEEETETDNDNTPRTAAGRRFAANPIHPDTSTSVHRCSRCRKNRYRWWFERFPPQRPS